MKHFFSLITVIAFISISYISSAQKILEEGYVKMEITKVTSDDPQMAMGLEMMKGSQTEVYFNKEKYVSYVSMMGGMLEMKIAVNNAKNEMNMLFDMMGQKKWVQSNLDQAQTEQEKQIADQSVIKYDKADTKEIMGYKCYKMTVTNPEMNDVNVSAYVTEDIKTKANLVQGFNSLEFAGYTMEFTIQSPQFAITMSAIDVKDTVDGTKLELDTKGYEKMTKEEFAKSMGGLGGGLGF